MNTRAAEALDRTLRLAHQLVGDASDERILTALTTTHICLVADAANLDSIAGQACITTLAGLTLALGCQLHLLMPEVPIRGYQPPLHGAELRSALLQFAADTVPGVDADIVPTSSTRDLVFILGDTPWQGAAREAWRLSGTAWSGTTAAATTDVRRFHGSFPLGALTAAAIAAVEPFKAALRTVLSDVVSDRSVREDLMPVAAARFALGPEVPLSHELALGRVDFVSGGAITNAALHVLLRLPRVTAQVRVIEPDQLDLTNLNRYLLARREQCERREYKVDALSRWQHPGFDISGITKRFDEANIAELTPLADHVVVGADHIPSRWLVQRIWPRWLGVGATADFATLTSEHAPGQPCVGCLHPYDDGVNQTIPTVSFVSYWAGLLVATRLVYQVLGLSCAPEQQALYLCPLQLDRRFAAMWQPVPRLLACPVCSANAA